MAHSCGKHGTGSGDKPRRRGISGSLREKYPVFFCFGDEPTNFLTHEQAIAATPQDRIRSIWPFLVDAVVKFEETLRPRERANFDAEDVVLEMYTKLLEKDSKWQPERGKYITFVARVITNEFTKLRDRTRTVRSPGNSYSRLREYEAEEATSSISPERLATLGAIRRALCNADTIEGLDPASREIPGPDEVAESREGLQQANDAMIQAFKGLSTEEAFAIGQAYGLWGQAEKTLDQIAASRGHTRGAVKAAQARTRQKMKDRLEAMKHPAATDDTNDEEMP